MLKTLFLRACKPCNIRLTENIVVAAFLEVA